MSSVSAVPGLQTKWKPGCVVFTCVYALHSMSLANVCIASISDRGIRIGYCMTFEIKIGRTARSKERTCMYNVRIGVDEIFAVSYDSNEPELELGIMICTSR